MVTLRESMVLAGNHLLNILVPERGYLPYWRIIYDQERRAEWQFYWTSHNVGRWWDALLRLEAALSSNGNAGFTIPMNIEARMLENLQRCLENPLEICCYLEPREGLPPGPDPAGWFDDHSQREMLLALTGLVRYRNLAWAAELGSRMVRALDNYILADGSWDIYRMGQIVREGGIIVPDGLLDWYANLKGFALIGNTGRLIEALIEFFTVSGDGAALKLADRLARFHLEVSTRPDGSTPQAEHIHTHSLFGTYRGLLLYGQLTRQSEYIERIAQSYLMTVRKHVRQSGFISHDLGTEKDGETAAPGDAAQLALWLNRSGYPEFLDDAERIVRARILPSQITKYPGLIPTVDDGHDEHIRLNERVIGAFGGMHVLSHGGKCPTTDITSADLHTLCDIYSHITESSPAGLQINFHFDFEDERIQIHCHREQDASLEIKLKHPQNLFIRIPAWTPFEEVQVWVNGFEQSQTYVGRFLFIPKAEQEMDIQVRYQLPLTILEETTDTVNYQIKWKGDDIIGIQPNTDWLPFYPSWS
jgi:hypothetical protein